MKAAAQLASSRLACAYFFVDWPVLKFNTYRDDLLADHLEEKLRCLIMLTLRAL
jgi:hypothetical protein